MSSRAVILAACLALVGCGSSGDDGPRFAAQTVLPGSPAAADFSLRDATGKTVKLSDFRGRPVLLTFLYSDCPDVCPLIASKLRTGLAQLGTRAGKARVVVVSVDPEADTPAAADAFIDRHGLTERMTYLLGTEAQLAPVWRAYGVRVAETPENRLIAHGSSVYGIDAEGRKRVLYGSEFTAEQVAHDIPLLEAG